MTGVRVDLANPNTYDSPREYVTQYLAPIVAELHRITNELISPGATSAEEWGVDMVPSSTALGSFHPLDKRLDDSPKHVVFDGAAYQSIPKELLRQKQLKVQLSAVVYAMNGDAAFRLVRSDGAIVLGSEFKTASREPLTITCRLPFGDSPGCIAPKQLSYIMQGKGLDLGAIPVCRRFSLSFTYV